MLGHWQKKQQIATDVGNETHGLPLCYREQQLSLNCPLLRLTIYDLGILI